MEELIQSNESLKTNENEININDILEVYCDNDKNNRE